MSDAALEMKLIRDTAAGWFAKLNNSTVSTDTLRAFRAWRNGDPRHDQAYLEIEAFWKRAAKLENDREIQQAAGAALERKPQGLGALPRPGGKAVTAALFSLLVVAGAALAWPTLVGRTYATAVGEQRFVALADGSRLRLDTRSRVRVRLGARQRDIELLAGRAFFDVAHDPARPFVVAADGARIRAIGTRFDVRRDPGGVQVVLVEGRVRVDGEAAGRPAAWTLEAGEAVRSGRDAPPAVRRVDAVQATSWTTGRLVFHAQPLSAAIAEVNRYSERPVVLRAPALAGRPVSGSFEIGDTPAFVSAVAELYDLKVDRSADAIVLRPAA
jgi:transmembrane sensor